MIANTKIHARSKFPSQATIGNAITEIAEAMSDNTLTGLRP